MYDLICIFLLATNTISMLYIFIKFISPIIRIKKMVENSALRFLNEVDLMEDEIGDGVDELRKKLVSLVLESDPIILSIDKKITKEKIEGMGDSDVRMLNDSYEGLLASRIRDTLGGTIIDMYCGVAKHVLKLPDKNTNNLNEKLKKDPFTDIAIKKLTSKIYSNFGHLIAPISISVLTIGEYMSSRCGGVEKNVEIINEENKCGIPESIQGKEEE